MNHVTQQPTEKKLKMSSHMNQNGTDPDSETGAVNCKIIRVTAGLWKCLTKVNCRHAIPFGNEKYCRHPYVEQKEDAKKPSS